MGEVHRYSEWKEALPFDENNSLGHKYSETISSITKEIGAERILDYGCGDGRLCNIFSHTSYLGLDIDKNAIDIAKQSNKKYCFEELENIVYSTDVCVMSDVLSFMNDADIDDILKRIRCKWILVADRIDVQIERKNILSFYKRKKEDYIKLMRIHDLLLFKQVNQSEENRNDNSTSFLLFKRCGRNLNL